MLIVQIVPKLPPAIGGVEDYALILARRLRSDFGIDTHFLVGDLSWEGEEKIEGFGVTRISQRNATSLLSSLPPNTDKILLHYVGYGYAKRGCPLWLIEGLERWRSQSQERFLVTMFHEVYAAGRPFWTSAFWLFPLQKNLASRLVKLCDRALTSVQLYAEILTLLSQGKHSHIPSLPVFSNVGEPLEVEPLTARKRQLVVFGGRSKRLQAYQQAATLNKVCQLLDLETILDIGTPTNLDFSTISRIPVREMGKLSAAEISRLMLDSVAGFFVNRPELLAKSTIFAAYCAHGLVPVNAYSNPQSTDGKEAEKSSWIPELEPKTLKIAKKVHSEPKVVFQEIANNAFSSYHKHDLSTHAQKFATYFFSDDR
ncbi:glycosyltransferase family 1 protein [Oscillatoria salina]|uniref:glycosyltransferase family 1 protein n=1 Tax=Oscillatoria salina TaxID=331517 RepID=UPI0013B89DFB|nr:glycosyltransferase family 1 protein [Oscillatoria salina]MBZ8179765.1 glycosyltransferase family 1 protein [Oscillatoria salina IIICB1]NET87724.1 glycosyltransferase family 1 protein [Kamptonema sp. SIO1D9]